jgi:hypothetical protein
MEYFDPSTFDTEPEKVNPLVIHQRDPRSSYKTKSLLFVWAPLIESIFSIGICTSFIFIRNQCNVTRGSDDLFFYVSLVILGLAIIQVLVCIYFLVRWKWAWYTTFAAPSGRDIEDLSPFFLMKSGASIQRDSMKIKSKFDSDKYKFENELDNC